MKIGRRSIAMFIGTTKQKKLFFLRKSEQLGYNLKPLRYMILKRSLFCSAFFQFIAFVYVLSTPACWHQLKSDTGKRRVDET